MKFVEPMSDLPANTLPSHAVDIFNTFVHCHLAQPDGSRNVVYTSFSQFSVNWCDCDLRYLCVSFAFSALMLLVGQQEALSLASVNSRLVLPFWYWLTRVVLEKGLLSVEFVEWHYSMWLYFVAVMCLWLSPPVDRAGGIVFRVISPSVCTCMQGSRYSPLGLPWLLFSVMFLICKTGRVKIIKLWRVKNIIVMLLV